MVHVVKKIILFSHFEKDFVSIKKNKREETNSILFTKAFIAPNSQNMN